MKFPDRKEALFMNLETIAVNFARPRMGRRLAVLTVSLVAIGLCVAVFKTVGFGTDPGSTFSLGISAWTGVSFGTCQLVFNALLFIPVLRLDLSRIGVGTIGNMVGLGYIADFFMWLIQSHMPAGGLFHDGESPPVCGQHGRVLDLRLLLHGGGHGRRAL